MISREYSAESGKRIGILSLSVAWGGLEINLVKLGVWLAQRGNHIVYYSVEHSRGVPRAQEAGLTTAIIPVKRKYLDFRAARALGVSASEHQLDCVIVGMSKDINLSVLSRLFSNNKFKIFYLQQMTIGITKRDLFHTLLYSQLDAWITPLDVLKAELLTKTRINQDKVKVIPLSIDIEKFESSAINTVKARLELGVPSNAVIAGMVSRPDPGKGHRFFIEALASLKKRSISVVGLIVGLKGLYEDDYGLEMEKLSEDLGLILDHDIFFKPFQPDPAIAYRAMDVFVMASLEETFGMVTVEAIVAGIPVMGTENLGPKEILENGKYGYMIQVANSSSIENALIDYIEHKPEWERRALLAKEMAVHRYGHETMCKAIEQMI